MQRAKLALFLTLLTGLLALAGTGLLFWSPDALASPEGATIIDPGVRQWGYVAAALATGLAALGAGLAVASVGSAAVGALAEKPEVFGRALVFVGLAEGIAIYGLIVSVLILNQLAG